MKTGKRVVDIQEFEGPYYDTPAEKAERHARKLKRQRKEPIIAWCRVG